MSKKNAYLSQKHCSPAIILIGAQLGENIGSVARAMLNFGLTDLRLVSPRPGWQLERAFKASAGADALIENRREFSSTNDAIADLSFVVATSARARDMVKAVLTPAEVAKRIEGLASAHEDARAGILFGCERTGLDNDDISKADVLCRVPLNPDFSSLNLAQAVLLLSYELYKVTDKTTMEVLPTPDTRPANRDEVLGMFSHLEAALDSSGFLAPEEKKPAMMRNIRNMFHRASLTEQDIRTFRGMINSMLRWPRDIDNGEIRVRVGEISKGVSENTASPERQEDS